MASNPPRTGSPRSIDNGHGFDSTLVLVGANHRSCPLDVREGLFRHVTYGRLKKSARNPPPWEELVLLSTCNRVEVYVLSRDPRFAEDVIRDAFGFPRDTTYLYALKGIDAASHLLRVASGLDSLAQGEIQVADQVRRAPEGKPKSWRTNGTLDAFFERAAHASSRIRALAGLDRIEASASQAAVRFILETVPLDQPTVVLIGSGKMARLAAAALRGRASLVIVDRNPSKARSIATELGGTSEALGRLEELLVRADAVIAATTATRHLVTAPALQRTFKARDGRDLWILDLGVPRNIDPRSREIDGLTLIDIDGLQPWALCPPSPDALARAEARIREEATAFMGALRVPGQDEIAALRRAVEVLRRREVQAALARLPAVTEAERAVIEKLTSRLVNRILHDPTEKLREMRARGQEAIVREFLVGWQDLGRLDL